LFSVWIQALILARSLLVLRSLGLGLAQVLA